MKEIGAIFVVSISEIRTVQLAAIKRRYNYHQTFLAKTPCYRTCKFILFFIYLKDALNPNLLNRQIMLHL